MHCTCAVHKVFLQCTSRCTTFNFCLGAHKISHYISGSPCLPGAQPKPSVLLCCAQKILHSILVLNHMRNIGLAAKVFVLIYSQGHWQQEYSLIEGDKAPYLIQQQNNKNFYPALLIHSICNNNTGSGLA